MTPKRLFLFAAYDPDGVIDSSVVLYVQELSKMGDVIFFMDSNASDAGLEKLKAYTISAVALRHGEYDFGSYKRAYQMAHDADILKNYSHVYLVNDSMYAPLRRIYPLIEKLESANTDANGMVLNAHPSHPHLQSWFLGMKPSVFLSDWFNTFIMNVRKLSDKGDVTHAYEHGFTRQLIQRNLSFTSVFCVTGRGIYNDIKRLYLSGLPFMKKVSFKRRHGALGYQVLYILDSIDPVMRAAILDNAYRVYGTSHVKKLLTKNVFAIAYRNAKHSIIKLFIEGI